MATYDASTHPLAFAHMEGGMKTVYVVPWTPEFSVLTSGDRIEFENLGSITIGTVRRYDTLRELVETEGFSNVVPETTSADECIQSLTDSEEWDENAVSDKGVLAFRVRWAKRKS